MANRGDARNGNQSHRPAATMNDSYEEHSAEFGSPTGVHPGRPQDNHESYSFEDEDGDLREGQEPQSHPRGGQPDYDFDASAISMLGERDEPFFSPNQSGLGGAGRSRLNDDDSALQAKAFDDQELSQILNPNLLRLAKTEPLRESHPNTQKSQMFLRKSFLLLETLLNKAKRQQIVSAWQSLTKSNHAADKTILELRKKIDRKKKRKEGLKRLGSIAEIYRRQLAVRAIDYWVEAMQRWKEHNAEQQRLIQVMVVMLGYKSKELSRIALVRLRNLETILEKEEKERIAKQKQIEKERADSVRHFSNLHELLRRLITLRQKDALLKIMQEAMNPYGGSRRNNTYARTAALMLMAHLIEKEVEREKKNAMNKIKARNDYILQYPNAKRIIDGSHCTARALRNSQLRHFGKKLFSYLKIKHNWAIRRGFSHMFEALAKAEKRQKNAGLRAIFSQNVNLLKYQKLCNYFAGLFSKLVKAQRRRNLQDAITNLKHKNTMSLFRNHNTKALTSRLTNMIFKVKKDAFRKIYMVPAVQELFNYERDKYERSVRLRGALKIGHSFANYYKKFLFERVRKALHHLRRFNHKYKKPAYLHRLESFRQVFDERRKESLHMGFQRLKGKSTLYLLQRFFRDTIDLSDGLNQNVLFALERNVPTKNNKINKMVEFWNTTFDLEDVPALERDLPDDPPFFEGRDENIVLSQKSIGGAPQFENPLSFQRTTQNPLSPYKYSQKSGLSQKKNQLSPKSPHPYNRHSEVCSVTCSSHLKNQTSPVTKPRVNQPRLLVPLNQPASQPTGSQKMKVDDFEADFMPRRIIEEKPKWPVDSTENAALAEFENFLQQSGQNSANASFTQFDSFSQKKPSQRDALDEALRESEHLSSLLEGSTRGPRVPKDRENIFKV